MQPWKISVGLTAILCAVGLMLAGQGFSWIGPYFWIVLTDFWFPVSGYAGLALVTLMFSLYSGARLLGLADMGRKVDLMERSIRRGEGGQLELAEKLEQEERLSTHPTRRGEGVPLRPCLSPNCRVTFPARSWPRLPCRFTPPAASGF